MCNQVYLTPLIWRIHQKVTDLQTRETPEVTYKLQSRPSSLLQCDLEAKHNGEKEAEICQTF